LPRPRKASNPADALVSVAPLATRWIERLLAAHEPPLTVAQLLALRAIADEGVGAADLARRSGVSGAAVSQLVADLERAGYVERTAAAADRRRRELALSPAGRAVLDSASAVLRERLGALLGGLPRPEADALTRLLERVGDALGGSPPPRRPPPRPEAHRPPPR
jgi:DNA-binding MarR family transcriptional regulator